MKKLRNILFTIWSFAGGVVAAYLSLAVLDSQAFHSMTEWIIIPVMIAFGVMAIGVALAYRLHVHVSDQEILRFLGVVGMICGIVACLADVFLATIHTVPAGSFLVLFGGGGLLFFGRSFMASKEEMKKRGF